MTTDLTREGLGFGVCEYTPTGLVFHEQNLYMVGRDTNKLYTLDVGTGMAEAVGSLSEGNPLHPTDLASHQGTLYMIDDDAGALYTLNTTTGKASYLKHMTAFGIDETCPKGLASHNNRLHIICEDPGIRSGAIRETEALPNVSPRKCTLYVLGDDIITNPTYTSKSSLGTHIHSACLYSANNALHIGVKDGGAFHIWSTEGGGTTRVPVTTVIEGMRADYRDGLFCVVGLKDYARFSRVGWSYDEILKEAADKRDMLHSLDDNIHELTDAMVDQILTFIHTRIQYVQFPPEQITNMQSLLVMVANAMRPNMYKNQQPSNDAGHLYAARQSLVGMLTLLMEAASPLH